MKNIFKVFPNFKADTVTKAKGPYLFTKKFGKILDTTAGTTSYAILGWSHPKILKIMSQQLKKFTHIDYKEYNDENLEKLSKVILKNNKTQLSKVYFSGNSGAESCEAALRMSYQVRHLQKKPEKKWFISRKQSYHGATADALALGDRPTTNFYQKTLSRFRAKIDMHHPLYKKKNYESEQEYALRSANLLEKKILQIGPEKVSGFVAETIMGGLVGDVPPAKNYWKHIRKICDRYDVHLIIDECYCGTGTTGEYFCINWDNISPDFLFIGKTLAAGYGALGAVLTTEKIYNPIKKYGRLMHSTTYQGHSLSAAAALEVQSHINNKKFLESVKSKGTYMMEILNSELNYLESFREVRGRGMRFSVEHKAKSNDKFARFIFEQMMKRKIFVSSKFHRTCFTPSLLLNYKEIDRILDSFIDVFKKAIKRNY